MTFFRFLGDDMMLSHISFEMFVDFVLGDSPSGEKGKILEHLKNCPACKSSCEQYAFDSALLDKKAKGSYFSEDIDYKDFMKNLRRKIDRKAKGKPKNRLNF
ncbi:MAG: hypothetical protein HYS08_10610 [Chlamydiae bacterium]|nr:hypothetical protein [Chlamydiota bacterium]